MMTTQNASVTEYRLAFRDWRGVLREIATQKCSSEKEARAFAHAEMEKFCTARNFKIYYTRAWNVDDTTIFDVGSHSEFFHLVPSITIGSTEE